MSLGVAGWAAWTVLASGVAATGAGQQGQPAPRASEQPRNVILVLSDDHRYDFMSFHPRAPDFLATPGLDRMARAGAHLANAFVTTSLCSPSRASILTGQYAHRHGVVDNTSGIPPGTVFFPELLQAAGWRTAYVGKWHMGEDVDDPRPGFDHWVSFRGQGVYVDPVLNVDGERRQVEGYTTDVLTDLALEWLERQSLESSSLESPSLENPSLESQAGDARSPFFLVLSHKAVHAEFVPAPRHAGTYRDVATPYPVTMPRTEANLRWQPRWVQAQRFSWHGVDYAYHGQFDFDTFYRRYAETLLALDESVGRVLDFLERSGLGERTLLLYLSDNGFSLGEHGLIDKRHAYEESIRIPMIAWGPGLVPAGATVVDLVRNIDVAPTILDLAGVAPSGVVDGRSVLPALRGEPMGSPGELLYEYYWEHAFPHTPTTFALRDERYKYIYYHGVWDSAELYDLEADPDERFNLIDLPDHGERAEAMRDRLWELLEQTGGMRIPLRRGDWQACERLVP
ncbi:MAG TPA: sulfatase [Thermoanaerobaculia bacterium]|nr:sulfatase [Thermoanaerobaculia bacterium]